MSDTKKIIKEIENEMGKFKLKNINYSKKDFVEFVEQKWAMADDEKYSMYYSGIIIGRMTNEYADIKDIDNMERWISEDKKLISDDENPEYVYNYYYAQFYLRAEEYETALEYLKKCYEENPEYIFTRCENKKCITFFCERMGIDANQYCIQEEEDFSEVIILQDWIDFFGENTKKMTYEIEENSKPTRKDKKAVKYIKENQKQILNIILNELLKKYPEIRKEYMGLCDEDAIPKITKIEEFSNLISPLGIHILSIDKDGMPYTGYAFGCPWEVEHGLGFMLHKDRIIEMGDAECSFSDFAALEDLNNC